MSASTPRTPTFALRRLGEFWRILGPDRPLYAAAIGVQALAAACQYVVPLVPQAVIDGVFSPEGTRMVVRHLDRQRLLLRRALEGADVV
jgi:hypothetical protein